MEKISRRISTFLHGGESIQFNRSIEEVRNSPGYPIKNYRQLVERVAILSFHNPEFVLFYRGQKQDFRSQNKLSSLYPSIFRGDDHLTGELLRKRFEELEKAGDLLREDYHYGLDGAKRIKTYRILRWAVLQHYDVCPTPLLDVTHSLHVASSFAYYENTEGEAFIYVLGLPQISGSVTASSEHGIQIIRLLSICPPDALRPYYQEGYLVGEYPTIGYREKLEYERKEVDFGQRLICKFRLVEKERFWDKDFRVIPSRYLFPDKKRDKFVRLTNELKRKLTDV